MKKLMINGQPLNLIIATFLFGWMVAKFRAALEKRAPIGYQDETGFHFGRER